MTSISKNSLVAAILMAALGTSQAVGAGVDSQTLLKAQENAGAWLMYGRNYLNQRFSPLDKINK